MKKPYHSNWLQPKLLTDYCSKWAVFCFFAVLLVSCSGSGRGAKVYLAEAETALKAGNFSLAKLKIDSIKTLFPKSYNEINQGFNLMQEVRMAENKRNIVFCDSMLDANYRELDNLLKTFTYVRDPQYQEFGNYVPKSYPMEKAFAENGLRSAVNEQGVMFIESVLSGSSLKHNKIKVSTRDNSFAESLPVTSDGLNYRFSTLNGTHEIVRYAGNDDNGVAKFIYTFKDEPISLTFIGSRSKTISLSDASKKGITQSFELSSLLLDIEKLKYEKERSEMLIKYLESKNKN